MEQGRLVTFLIESNDKTLAAEAREAFAGDEVSVSSNLIGGVEIAIFFLAASKPLVDLLKAVLAFQAERAKRYQSSKIVIGADSLELSGFGPDDIERLQSLPMFSPSSDPPELS